MDKMLLKKTAVQSVALMLAVITLSYALHQYQAVTISASDTTASEDFLTSSETAAASEEDSGASQNTQTDDPLSVNNQSDSDNIVSEQPEIVKLMNGVNPEKLDKMGDRYLVIKKPQGSNISFHLEDLYVTKSIQIELTGLAGENLDSRMIGRAIYDEAFTGDPVYTEIVTPDTNKSDGTNQPVITKDFGNDFVHGITFTYKYDDKNKSYTSDILIELDSVYAQIVQEDQEYYYIDLKNPKDVYDKILVIDAGHGGKDGGAPSLGEQFYEKNINLGILLQLKKLLDKENIKVYYTRTGDDKVFLRPRVELANAVDCDFFISIHCNSNEVSWPNGTEILYYDTDFKGVKAKNLADLFSVELSKTIPLAPRGLVKKQGDEIFILDHAEVPAILIEVGYLSNNNDMNYLSKEKNRKEVAQGIFNGIMKAYELYKGK
jgi:N-acetylmuramoyl-L-alanine amidase